MCLIRCCSLTHSFSLTLSLTLTLSIALSFLCSSSISVAYAFENIVCPCLLYYCCCYIFVCCLKSTNELSFDWEKKFYALRKTIIHRLKRQLNAFPFSSYDLTIKTKHWKRNSCEVKHAHGWKINGWTNIQIIYTFKGASVKLHVSSEITYTDHFFYLSFLAKYS